MAWANAQWPQAQFDFRGAHVDAVNPTLEEFTKLAARYPEAVRRLRYVGTYQGVGAPQQEKAFSERVYAHVYENGRVIGLNPAWFGDPDRLRGQISLEMLLGNSPARSNRLGYPIAHEFGHLVLWTLPDDQALAVSGWLDNAFPPADLSRYAKVSRDEAFAEGLAAMQFQPQVVYGSVGKFR